MQSNDAARVIDSVPGEFGDFAVSPAGVIGKIEDVLIGRRQLPADGEILRVFKEALSRRIFRQTLREAQAWR